MHVYEDGETARSGSIQPGEEGEADHAHFLHSQAGGEQQLERPGADCLSGVGAPADRGLVHGDCLANQTVVGQVVDNATTHLDTVTLVT